MSKPLSETHPTLWFELDRNGFPMDDENSNWAFKKIQSCTVDVAEHERLKIDYQDALGSVRELENRRDELLAEVERLKKELYRFNRMEAGSTDFHNGVIEGERRAMERVKEAIKTSLTAYQVEQKLGLGEEEKR